MLIILPPSETKRPAPAHGDPVDLGALSFPELTAVRTRVLNALIATSAGPHAMERLQVGPLNAGDVLRNTFVRDVPTMPALEVYSGPLHAALDAGSLSEIATERAGRGLVVTSPLWGVIRPADRIPPYRLHICARLTGIDRLKGAWQPVLGEALAEAAGPDALILDLRSPNYQAMGIATGLGDRTINVNVGNTAMSGRRIGDVGAKQVRGLAARRLLESGEDFREPGQLARFLAERWPARLREPERAGKPWTLTLTKDD